MWGDQVYEYNGLDYFCLVLKLCFHNHCTFHVQLMRGLTRIYVSVSLSFFVHFGVSSIDSQRSQTKDYLLLTPWLPDLLTQAGQLGHFTIAIRLLIGCSFFFAIKFCTKSSLSNIVTRNHVLCNIILIVGTYLYLSTLVYLLSEQYEFSTQGQNFSKNN